MNSHFSVGHLDDEKNQLYRILRLEVIGKTTHPRLARLSLRVLMFVHWKVNAE